MPHRFHLPQATLLLGDLLLADQASGKFSLIGLCDRLVAFDFPAPFHLAMVAKLWGITEPGRHRCQFVILHAETREQIYDSPVHDFTVEAAIDGLPLFGVQHTSANVDDIEVQEPGFYELQFRVDGQPLAILPVLVELPGFEEDEFPAG